MKLASFLCVLPALFVIGCENLHQTIRTGTIISDAPPGQPALLIGNHDFTDFESVRTYVRALPHGAIFYWDTPGRRTDLVPVAKADMTVDEFAAYCRSNGATFQFVEDPRKDVRRVYVLRPSAFRSFCELLTSPAMNSVKARQAFAECGVPYAADVQGYFENAGIVFPPKSSLIYDRSNGRLILNNNPASAPGVSQLIWAAQTPAFDAKVRCLATRMQGRELAQ